MTGYEFGDIVLIPFPFADQTTAKKRPAVAFHILPWSIGIFTR